MSISTRTRGLVALVCLLILAAALVLPSCAAPPPGVVIVTCKGKQFNPATITIKEGMTVRWINKDDTAHTTTSNTYIIGVSGKHEPKGSWNSNPLNPGETFEHTFTSSGDFPYACLVHPYMEGTVTVQPK